jgi:predicted kinase
MVLGLAAPLRHNPPLLFLTEEDFGEMPAGILLLWGAPAAGKTSIMRGVRAEYRARTGRSLPCLGTDDLRRAVIGTEYDSDVRNAVYTGIVTMVDSLLEAKMDVLVDGNYLDQWRRQELIDVAQRHQARLASVLVHCTLASRLSRDSARPPEEHVPETYVRHAHECSETFLEDNDLLIDTDSVAPPEAVRMVMALVDQMGIGVR